MATDPPSPPPASALMDELVEEVLLRFPPADPALLVRAALVCTRWRDIVTGAGFRLRFRELHRRAPPMLGLLCNGGPGTRFLPFSAFRPPGLRAAAAGGAAGLLIRGWRALDARHGRVLLRWDGSGGRGGRGPALVVWDPVTDRRTDLPTPPWAPHPYSWNAAVLCAAGAAACDHLDCCGGHFLVVVVGTNTDEMFACVYSSEAGAWSEPTSARHPNDNVDFAPSALVGNALYFAFQMGTAVLEYDLGTREMAVICLPPAHFNWQRIVLATRDDGRLGFATADKSTIHLWSREVRPGGDALWALNRVIELDKLLPVGALSAFSDVAGFVDAAGVIFVRTGDGLFTIDLKSNRVTKVSNDIGFSGIFPFMSFLTPAAGVPSAGGGSSAGA